MADSPIPSAKPAVPFVRQAFSADGRPTGLVRVGGKDARMPPPRPSRTPEPGTLMAHALLRQTPAAFIAGVKNHAGLQDNSELSLAEFDRLVAEAGSIKISGR